MQRCCCCCRCCWDRLGQAKCINRKLKPKKQKQSQRSNNNTNNNNNRGTTSTLDWRQLLTQLCGIFNSFKFFLIFLRQRRLSIFTSGLFLLFYFFRKFTFTNLSRNQPAQPAKSVFHLLEPRFPKDLTSTPKSCNPWQSRTVAETQTKTGTQSKTGTKFAF